MTSRTAVRRPARGLLVLGTVAVGAVLSLSTDAGADPFAATASLAPNHYYIGDSTGSVYAFTVTNAGSSVDIGAVEIARPATAGWTVKGCPAPSAGWTAQRSDAKCRFRSAATSNDDIKPGQSRTFSVRATTAKGTADRTGTWPVVVSSSNHFDKPSLLKFATPTGPGLATTSHTFELTTAVVSDTVRTPGTACPAANKEALVGSTKTIVVCGRNRATTALTPVSTHSSLGGPYIQTPGTFLSGSIPKTSGNVVLADWTGTQIAGVFGTYDLTARIGSAANRTSPLTTFTGYDATSQPPVANDDAYTTDEDDPLVVPAVNGVLDNDTDAESDPLTAGDASTPAHGTVSLNSDGSFTYTPDVDFHGEDSFTYTANDTHTDSAPATVDITVEPVNDAPVAVAGTATTDEDTPKAITLDASDVDGDSLTYEIVDAPDHGDLDASSGDESFTYTPDVDYHGADSFTFRATDGLLASLTVTVDVTVDSVNDPPVAVGDGPYVTDEDTPLVVLSFEGVLDNDTDVENDPLTAAIVSGPAHGDATVHPSGGFSYTPDADFHGSDEFTYVANDGADDSVAGTVTITVSPVNDDPVANDVTDATDEDTAQVITLDADDVDGDALSYEIIGGPLHGDLDGTFGDESFTYTPDPDYHGADSFTYTATDGLLTSNTATVYLTANPVNDAPVAGGDAYNATEDTTLGPVLASVLDDDSDVDLDSLTAVLVSGPANAESFSLETDGTFTYLPAANFHGADSFTYYAYDGTIGSNVATVEITVDPVNDVPVVDAGTSSGLEDTPQSVDLGGRDPVEVSNVTFEIVDAPDFGDLGPILNTTCGTSCTADVEYTPDANYNGPDEFTYRTYDGIDYSDPATVSLTVTPVNDVPSFTAGPDVRVVQDLPAQTISPWATAQSKGPADESAQILTFTTSVTDVTPSDLFVTDPEVDPDTGALTFETTFGEVGTATVSVVLSDDGGTDDGGDDTSDAQVFTIDVVPPNSPPTADSETATVDEDGSVVVVLSADDPDGDDLTFVVGDGDHGVVSEPYDVACVVGTCTAKVDYEPDANYFGTDAFTFHVVDDNALPLESDDATVDVTVSSVNDEPSDIALSGSTVDENVLLGTDIGSFTTTDADTADTHLYTLVGGTGSTDNLSFAIVDDTIETNTALDHEVKDSYSVRVRSTDSGTGALYFEEAFTITVNDLNDDPTDVALTPSSVAENQAVATTVGTLSTTDQDAGDTHTYTFATGPGNGDNGSFSIDGSTLKTAAEFDFEADGSYSIRVRSTDAGGLFFEKVLSVTVTNVNEIPTDLALSAQSIDENEPTASTVGTLSTTDPDAGDTHTYALVPGTGDTDNGSFSIAGSALKANPSFNYEVKSSYSILVRTTDGGGLTRTEQLTITVVDVNDNPVAVDDVFNDAAGNKDAIGNTKLTVGVAGQAAPVKNVSGTALGNDTDEDTLPSADTLTITFPATTTNGTIVTGNSDGTFVYLPNAGFKGNDTFTYTLSDGQGGTDTGQVTIQVNNMVWYVDDSAPAGGTGRSTAPYQTMTPLQGTDLDGTGDTIFVYSGAYGVGIPLEASQELRGEPAGLTVDGVSLVAAGGTNPTIGHTSGDAIGLANDVVVQRVDTGGPITGAGVRGANITNATIGLNTTINGGTAGGVVLTGNGAGTISVSSSITNTSGAAINVSNRTGGTVTFIGGVLDGGSGIVIGSNNATISLQGIISMTGAGGVSLSSNTGGSTTLSNTLTTANGGIAATGNTGHSMVFSGALHLTGTGSTKAFSVTGGGAVVATSTDNTATTNTGRAVEITNATTIGATGVTFKTVTAGTAASGPDSGIVLDGTGTAGGLTVTGTTSVADSGGIIQKTTSHAVSLTNTDKVSLNWMRLLNPAHAGVKGVGVTDFTMTRSTVSGAGAALTDQTDYSIAFNTVVLNAQNNNVDGVVTITDNALSNAFGGGIQVLNTAGTISNAVVTGNTVTSTTSTATSKGSGIRFDLFGTATSVASMTKANIATNVVTNFPSGDGITVTGGNAASGTAPSGTYGIPSGIPGSGANRIVVTGNTVQGNAASLMNGFGIAASVAGRGQGNFDVTSNGTVALPITHVKGSGIAIGAAGDVVVDFNVTNNHVNGTDNILGNDAIGIGMDKNQQANNAILASPLMRIVVSNNTVTGSTGYGINSLNRDSNGTTLIKAQNNNVAGPVTNGSLNVTSGSSGDPAYNPTVCAQISGNTLATGVLSAGGNGEPGILLDKYSTSSTTYRLGLVGLPQNPATDVQAETYLAGQNPASGMGVGFWAGKRAAVVQGDNFTPCTLGF